MKLQAKISVADNTNNNNQSNKTEVCVGFCKCARKNLGAGVQFRVRIHREQKSFAIQGYEKS